LQEKGKLNEKRIKITEAYSWKRTTVRVIKILEEALI